MEAHVYSAYKTETAIVARGRVVNASTLITAPDNEESPLRRLHRTLAYGQLAPVRNAPFFVKIGSTHHPVMTNASGYFELESAIADAKPYSTLEIFDAESKKAKRTSIGRSHILDIRNKKTILISDLDGTIIDNKPYNQFRLFLNTMISSSEIMTPFENAGLFFGKLQKNDIPVFYVSSSPDQLYPRLQRFLVSKGMPQGPLYLKPLKHRDLKGQIAELKNNTDSKTQQITDILNAFPNHQFILLGDDANDDVEIFEELEKNFSHQLKLVAIHKINSASKTQTRGKQLPYVSYEDLTLKCVDLGIFP